MKTTLALAVLATCLTVASAARKMDDGCSTVLYDISGCMEYLTAGSNLTEPSNSECCIEFVTAMKASRSCICDAVKYSNKIGLDISLTKANKLPSICHSNTHILCEDHEASLAPTPSMTPSDDEAEAPSPNSSTDHKHKKHVKAPAPAPAENESGVNSAGAIVSVSVCSLGLALLLANSFFILV